MSTSYKIKSASETQLSEMKEIPLFAESSTIVLRPMRASDKQFYLDVCEPWLNKPPFAGIHEMAQECTWGEANEAYTFYCIIEEKTIGKIGYIGIKNTLKEMWELSIELLAKYCHKGYGTQSVLLFLDQLKKITGHTQFHVLVEVDNIASQCLMQKINAKPLGIVKLFYEDDQTAANYEELHLNEITDRMETLANEFGVKVRKLLTHVLDYELNC